MAYKSFDPFRQELIGEYGTDSDKSLYMKIQTVHTAFGKWRNITLSRRCELFNILADMLSDEKETHALVIVREMGKPISQALAEVEKCAMLCRYYASRAEEFLSPGERQSGARRSLVAFEPQGIILGIMPWNFPYWQAFRFLVPSMLAGNCALLKHASNVTGCALKIEDIFTRAGFPESVFKVVLPAHTQMERIISMAEIRGVVLTGSNEAGSVVASYAGRYIKKTVLELGGSDPLIVFADANLEAAATGAFTGRFLNSGQSCIASKRLIIHESVYDSFLEIFLRLVKNAKAGDPADRDVFFGPLVSNAAAEVIGDQVDRSIKMGSKLIRGGVAGEWGPAFYSPTVLTDIPEGTPMANEEIFGPVAPLFTFSSVDQTVEIANSSRYGLGASLWSMDEEFAMKIARRLDSGSVAINGYTRSDQNLPFGGVKDSGYGRELSYEGIHEFVNVKTIAIY
jgi:succinate-semialdehyde dehydrogenase / glutarate-semialdehyde dehydrogenase